MRISVPGKIFTAHRMNFQTGNAASLDSLPTDIQIAITDRLSHQSLAQMSRLNASWREICADRLSDPEVAKKSFIETYGISSSNSLYHENLLDWPELATVAYQLEAKALKTLGLKAQNLSSQERGGILRLVCITMKGRSSYFLPTNLRFQLLREINIIMAGRQSKFPNRSWQNFLRNNMHRLPMAYDARGPLRKLRDLPTSLLLRCAESIAVRLLGLSHF